MIVPSVITTDAFGLSFHHFGLLVPEPGAAFRFLSGLGYTGGASVFDPLQGVNLAIRHHSVMPDVEVIWPGSVPSPIHRLIQRGHMIYHLCFVTANAELSLAAFENAGLDVVAVGETRPAVLFGGALVSFHSIDQIGLIELIHGEAKHSEQTSDRMIDARSIEAYTAAQGLAGTQSETV